jgi:hypothetical protein
MPSLTPICLSQSRIESSDEITEGLTVHAVNPSFLGTEEDPRVLAWIPEQRTLLLLLLVILRTQ